jgi:peroxiredoxin
VHANVFVTLPRYYEAVFRWRLVAVVAMFVALAGCSLPWQPATPAAGGRPAAPAFTLRGLDGRDHALADYRGKVVLVNFWATWCIPCRAEIPDLEHEARTQDPGQVVIVGVDSREAPEPVQGFISDLGVTYPILLDRDGAVYDRYQVDSLPQTFIVDREGRVASARTGIVSREQVEAEIRAVAG